MNMMHSQTTLQVHKKNRNIKRHGYGKDGFQYVKPEDYFCKKLGVLIGTETTRVMYNRWGKCGQCLENSSKPCYTHLVGAQTTPITSCLKLEKDGNFAHWHNPKTCNGKELTHSDCVRVHNTSKKNGWDSAFYQAAVHQTFAVEDIPSDIVEIFVENAPNFSNAKTKYVEGQFKDIDYSEEMAKFALLEKLMRSVVPDFDRIQRLSKAEETAKAVANKIEKAAKAAAKAAAQEDDMNVLLARGSAILQFANNLHAVAQTTGTLPIPKRTLEVDEVDDESRPSKDKRMRLEFLLS